MAENNGLRTMLNSIAKSAYDKQGMDGLTALLTEEGFKEARDAYVAELVDFTDKFTKRVRVSCLIECSHSCFSKLMMAHSHQEV